MKPNVFRLLYWPSIGAAVLALASPLRVEGQAVVGPESPAEGHVGAIQSDAPQFLVRAALNRSSASYVEGDSLSLQVVSERDAFVHVLYEQADGRVFQIFPNRLQPDNRLRARVAVAIPSRDDAYRWTIGPPFGKERIKVVASQAPLSRLASSDLTRERFNPVAPRQLKGIELEIDTEVELELQTAARSGRERLVQPRRVGVFFGVSHYEFNAEYEQLTGKPLNLPTCHRDARRLAALMREVGRLDDVRVYTNELATREQIEESMTRWLPSVTGPGDTVFLYFSGHGMQAPDDNGDEADGQDEILAPYGTAAEAIVQVLRKRSRASGVSAAERNAAAARAAELERIGGPLLRRTGVSDDLFGHWLQSLDGRRVAVTLDICFAGGFADDEKGVAASDTAPTFDFLDSEVERLKDIGQRDMVLLASSSARTTSAMRGDTFPDNQGPLSVLTSYLVDSLLRSRGPVTIEDWYVYSRKGMKAYFDGHPQKAPHVPQLSQRLSEPFYVRP